MLSIHQSTVREWNNLPSDVTQSESIAAFKHNLNRENLVVLKHFYTGKRNAQILHTRLRTRCNALNYDLFLKNITDSPLCHCGDIENTYHFFFQCPQYRNSRTELFETVSQYKEISLDLLLFGDISLSYDINKKYSRKSKIYNHYQEIHCHAVIIRMYKIILVKLTMRLVLF